MSMTSNVRRKQSCRNRGLENSGKRIKRGNAEGKSQQERYITEIFGNTDRLLKKHVLYFYFCFPIPQKNTMKDENYLKTEEMRVRQEASKTLDSQYFPSCISNTGKALCALSQIANKEINEKHNKIFLVKSVLCSVRCDDCNKPRVVYLLKIQKIQTNKSR